MNDHITVDDYPLSEKRPELVCGQRGKKLSDVTLGALMQGDVEMQDLRITRDALLMQAQIAKAANRSTLAQNFDRAAELVQIPQDFLMHVYELLRPGRAKSKRDMMEAARQLREAHQAEKMASFVEEAADVYERRGLFTYRF
jgi:propanediol dehydratase small subunit